MTDPAEWEGSSAGGVGGGNHLYPFPFLHISISKDPRWLDTQLCFSQEASRANAALAWPETRAVAKATQRRLNTWRTGNSWDTVLIRVVQKWPWQRVNRANCLHLKPCTKAGSQRAKRWNKTAYEREKGQRWGRNQQRQSYWEIHDLKTVIRSENCSYCSANTATDKHGCHREVSNTDTNRETITAAYHEAVEGEGTERDQCWHRAKRRRRRTMGMQEDVWWGSGGIYLEGLPEPISQSADLREDVTNEEGLWHAAAPQCDQVLRQPLCSLELRFGTTRLYWWRLLATFFLLTFITWLHEEYKIWKIDWL